MSESIVSRLDVEFTALFGKAPERIFSAPGRVNLIGEHTDYNEGFVMPVAIDRRTFLGVRSRDDAVIRVVAGDFGDRASLWMPRPGQAVEKDNDKGWANYLRGVTEQFRKRGLPIQGMDVYIRSDIPAGAGLGSSAALCTAFALAMNKLNHLDIGIRDLALWCQAAEHDYLASRCGVMDQFVSLHGRERQALLIDCRSLEVEAVVLPEDMALVIIESGVTHNHAGGQYNERRTQCEEAARAMKVSSLRDATMDQLDSLAGEMDEVAFHRARHVLSENARTLAAADPLSAGDYPALAELMAGSHASMRDDFEITTPEIDTLVELIARELGGSGGVRMTGGGFGGSVLVLAHESAAGKVDQELIDQYRCLTGKKARIHRCGTGGRAGEH